MQNRNNIGVIPPNYSYINQKIRNIIEAIIIDGIAIAIILNFDMSYESNAYAFLVLIPITVLLVVGINEQSVSAVLINMIRFKSNKRVLGKPNAEYKRKKDKALLKKEQKEMRLKRGN